MLPIAEVRHRKQSAETTRKHMRQIRFHSMTVVVDDDTGRVLWAAPRRDTATLRRFVDVLGADRCALITQVSADAAGW
jgi:transposase